MTDRPIIFSAPMILALLAGRKTQTRRLLKDQTVFDGKEAIVKRWPRQQGVSIYKPGDRLWVRESCGRRPASFLGIEATNGVESAFYMADNEDVLDAREFNICPWWKSKACPSIHMPRWASRLTLTVTDLRVQRLWEISKEDVIAEGITERDGSPIEDVWAGWHEPYAALWESLHGKGSWDINPWIVALTFSVARGNIDALAKQVPA